MNVMNRKKHPKDLIGYIRGRLPESEAFRIREHLKSCGDCQDLADRLTKTLAVIQTEKAIAPDPFLATRIAGLLQAATDMPTKKSLSSRLVPALVFSLFLLAGAAGGFGLARLILPDSTVTGNTADTELAVLMDELRQEPFEAFILEYED
jgi:anti-sigma factor RsiW